MKAKMVEDDAMVKVHRIRITLTSRNVQNLEKGTYTPWQRCMLRPCTHTCSALGLGHGRTRGRGDVHAQARACIVGVPAAPMRAAKGA